MHWNVILGYLSNEQNMYQNVIATNEIFLLNQFKFNNRKIIILMGIKRENIACMTVYGT